jgi:FKBP-type peptidyl-prolyl cis-trans isomerase
MKRLLTVVLSVALSGILFSCQQKEVSEYPGYTKLEDNLYLKYSHKNESGRKINVGDIVTLDMKYTTEDDSVIFESKPGQPPVQLRVDSAKYTGDFMNALLDMNMGDSASFIVSADSFFIRTAGMPQSPDFIDSASMLYFTVHVKDVQSMEELQQQQAEENARLQQEENTKLQQYLQDNNITAEANESGLIFISKKKGTGKAAEAGKTVKVNYEGKLLDGTYFDTSVEEVAKEQNLYNPNRPYEPFEFTLGQGQVIQGWDEGIAMMKEGGKATLIIPSDLAYGANPRPGGVITPYATLVFDVELVEVKD